MCELTSVKLGWPTFNTIFNGTFSIYHVTTLLHPMDKIYQTSKLKHHSFWLNGDNLQIEFLFFN
jgi:hypothetical protein